MAQDIYRVKRRNGDIGTISVLLTNDNWRTPKENIIKQILSSLNTPLSTIHNPFISATFIKRTI